jgi:putative salt-induced outer membrane protein YdiY
MSSLLETRAGRSRWTFFITKRLFWFASAYFEKDTFQDLKLRTAQSSGPGYQFIEKGNYSSLWLKDMTLYAEAGSSYFNEDYTNASDQSSFRGRWAVRLNWPILDERITFYHYQEFYPSLQNTKSYYMTMDNGVRFRIIAGFVSGIQVTTRYNGTPAQGTGNTDNLYLLTLGYSFDTTKKR